MPSQIESISPFEVALGVIVALLLVALVVLGYYHPAPSALVAAVLLAFVVALQGVKPFGETIAYRILQAGVFAFWGIIVTFTEEMSIISVVFVVIGILGILYYGYQAVQQGIWTQAT